MESFDVIVIGVGGMGSATLFDLARRGLKVLGIERYGIPHNMGSSHGITRIIRLAYYEHPSYVPLLRRSFELWRELELIADERLLVITGSIDVAPVGDRVFEGSRESCELHHLPHEVLDSTELHRRFPGYQFPVGMKAVYQSDGGYLLPERCIVSFVNAALALGAVVHGQEQVISWSVAGDGVEVVTDRDHYRAGKLVITAGPWSSQLVPSLLQYAVPERQVLAWFQPLDPGLFTPAKFPVFNMAAEEGRFYGFPVHEVPGFKIGRWHHLEQVVDPDQIDRQTHPEDELVLRTCTQRYFPQAAGPVLSMKTCMFTNSPDENFIIDVLSETPRVVVAAGFSGHGFKFCSVVGEILGDLATRGITRHDLSLFRLNRFV
jgi:sarcosine oxidase